MQQGAGALVYFVFDVLELDGEPLVDLPLAERRDAARAGSSTTAAAVRALGGVRRRRRARSRPREQQGLEGVMAKRVDSPYEPRRRSRTG